MTFDPYVAKQWTKKRDKHREHENIPSFLTPNLPSSQQDLVACPGHYVIHLRNVRAWSSRHSANLLPTRSYVFYVGQTEFQKALE